MANQKYAIIRFDFADGRWGFVDLVSPQMPSWFVWSIVGILCVSILLSIMVIYAGIQF